MSKRWLRTYPLRLRELLWWKKYQPHWHAEYEDGHASKRALALETSIRIAELLGIGLVYAVLECLLASSRYRSLSEEESAFAKTYFSPAHLENVWIDEGAAWIAKPLRIAYVSGTVIKCWGKPSLPLLVHELVHVQQYRRWGWAYVAKALSAQWFGAGYYYTARSGAALNAEQEAARLEDRARLDLGLAPRWLR